MSVSRCKRRLLCVAPIVAWAALQGVHVFTQEEQQPINSGANPYKTIRDWAEVPAGRPWGGSNGVAIDRDGKSVWTVDRCSPGTAPGCLGVKADPVQKFDE